MTEYWVLSQSPKDPWQHPQVRAHLPLDFHWPRRGEEQGSYLPIPRQQVYHCLAHRLLLWWVKRVALALSYPALLQ